MSDSVGINTCASDVTLRLQICIELADPSPAWPSANVQSWTTKRLNADKGTSERFETLP